MAKESYFPYFLEHHQTIRCHLIFLKMALVASANDLVVSTTGCILKTALYALPLSGIFALQHIKHVLFLLDQRSACNLMALKASTTSLAG